MWLMILFFITLIDQNASTHNHLVYAGSCTEFDEDFCSRQVENSVCNRLKNECFCRKDFVAIREHGKVTCKTLLTDLTCRVDRDCVHVNRSSCHPGAGFCSCPGNTIYVPEIHACRNRWESPEEPTCTSCRKYSGTCFRYDEFDLGQTEKNQNPHLIGCVCSRNGHHIPVRGKGDWVSGICGASLVDLGDFCDEEKFFCRSRNAVCLPYSPKLSGGSSRKSNEVRICKCQDNSVPVYQKRLQYTECFRKLPNGSPNCGNCDKMHGVCYDLNDDGIGDGCNCLPENSHGITLRGDNSGICGKQHVAVNCTDGYYSVCYMPHVESPYENLEVDLKENRASVALIPSNYVPEGLFMEISHRAEDSVETYKSVEVTRYSGPPHRSLRQKNPCELVAYDSLNESERHQLKNRFSMINLAKSDSRTPRSFCVHLDVWRSNVICGVQIYKVFGDLVQYEALLELTVTRGSRTLYRDKRIQMNCLSTPPRRTPTFAKGEKLHEASFDVDLRVLNQGNKEVLLVTEGTEIRLDALLTDRTGKYKAVAIESCRSSNRTTREISDWRDENIFIQSGCPVSETAPAFTNGLYPKGHVQSGLFPAVRTSDLSSVFFSCIFKVCANPADCTQLPCKSTVHNEGIFTRKTNLTWNLQAQNRDLIPANPEHFGANGVITLERWTHLEVHSDQRNFHTPLFTEFKSVDLERPVQWDAEDQSPHADREPRCRHVLCLGAAQIIWILSSLLFLFSILLTIIYVVYRRYLLRSQIQSTELDGMKSPPEYLTKIPKRSSIQGCWNSFESPRSPRSIVPSYIRCLGPDNMAVRIPNIRAGQSFDPYCYSNKDIGLMDSEKNLSSSANAPVALFNSVAYCDCRNSSTINDAQEPIPPLTDSSKDSSTQPMFGLTSFNMEDCDEYRNVGRESDYGRISQTLIQHIPHYVTFKARNTKRNDHSPDFSLCQENPHYLQSPQKLTPYGQSDGRPQTRNFLMLNNNSRNDFLRNEVANCDLLRTSDATL